MGMKTKIKQKAKEYAQSIAQSEERARYCEEDFAKGAEWMQEQMMTKAQEFFDEDLFEEEIDENDKYVCSAHANSIGELLENYKKAMEE
jgi:hypothetical protein